MTYFEKLKHPLWQKKRLEVFERENFTCQSCRDADKTLHIHHTYYKPDYEPWDYPSDSLQCLCENCHKEQKRRKECLKIIEEKANTSYLEKIVGEGYSFEIFSAISSDNIDKIDRNAQIKITKGIIYGFCNDGSWRNYPKLNSLLRSFLNNWLESKEMITYGDIIDFIDSQNLGGDNE